ncbi:MAG TPA: cellulase family glycosylhydrolase [Acidimicrobiales bacterium]|nr:cellulase family glycosylhydrolase [Acidimicrobiales bacterium]
MRWIRRRPILPDALPKVVGALVLGAFLATGLPAAGVPAAAGAPAAPGVPYVHGYLSAGPGRWIRDSSGRVVILHGVNAVYKLAPYVVYPDPGHPWNFTDAQAATMARLGFTVVRLGILWRGLEPGTAGPNDPAICAKGAPGDPGQWDPAVAERYLDKVAATVAILGRHHIYTLLDMHQDVYSNPFTGEGAPLWAICTGGRPIEPVAGRWSNNYGDPALDAAFANFWTNDVAGDLQGEYDRAWAAVAARFASDPWVAGYDPFNEPFTRTIALIPPDGIDLRLECFYTGTAAPDVVNGVRLTCPPGDPAQGLIPIIRAVDPRHLIFREPTIFSQHGQPNYVGPIDQPNLVLNFHDYCGYRSGVTGNPYDLPACIAQEVRSVRQRLAEAPTDAVAAEPAGLPVFLSEFGATQSVALVRAITSVADRALIGWSYWSWKYYDDPTGSSAEAMVSDDGRLRPIAGALSETYPTAVAGTPRVIAFRPRRGLTLDYVADPAVRAPTLVWAGQHPYCATTSAGRIVSDPGAAVVEVAGPSRAGPVRVTVAPGPCPG